MNVPVGGSSSGGASRVRGRHRKAIGFGVLGYLGVLAASVAAAAFVSSGDVVAKGNFVPSVDHDVVSVRVLDSFTLYVDETVVPLSSDMLTSAALLLVSGAALLTFALTSAAAPHQRREQVFFALTAMVATFLAFDEQYELIDSLGYNVEFLYVPDLFLYGPAAILGAFLFRRIIVASRPALAVFAAAAVLVTVAQVIDRAPEDRFEGVEEKLEVIGSFVAGGAFLVLAVHHLIRLTSAAACDQIPTSGRCTPS